MPLPIGARVRIKPLPHGDGKRYLEGRLGTVLAAYPCPEIDWLYDVMPDGSSLPVSYFASALERL